MHQLVEKYLEKMSEQQAKDELEKKNKLLINLGLYEKEYSENGEYSKEFTNMKYDTKTGKTLYFRKKPVEVSDEEYAEILKYQKEEEQKNYEKNTVASAFNILAWITFIVGFLTGIVLFFNDEFAFFGGAMCWGASFISGMLFIGVSEIIQLLTDIKNK